MTTNDLSNNPNQLDTIAVAGFWRRAAAFVFDTFILFIVVNTLITPIRNGFPSVMPLVAVLFMTLFALYLLFRDARYPFRSLGKRLFKLKTVSENNQASRPAGFGQSVLRNILLVIPLTMFLEIWVLALRKDRRRIGDLLASTRVVRS